MRRMCCSRQETTHGCLVCSGKRRENLLVILQIATIFHHPFLHHFNPYAPLWGAFKYLHKSIPAGFRVVSGLFTSHCCLASLATPCGTVCSYVVPPDTHSPHCLWDSLRHRRGGYRWFLTIRLSASQGRARTMGSWGHISDRSDNNGIVRLDPV